MRKIYRSLIRSVKKSGGIFCGNASVTRSKNVVVFRELKNSTRNFIYNFFAIRYSKKLFNIKKVSDKEIIYIYTKVLNTETKSSIVPNNHDRKYCFRNQNELIDCKYLFIRWSECQIILRYFTPNTFQWKSLRSNFIKLCPPVCVCIPGQQLIYTYIWTELRCKFINSHN